VIPTLVLAGAIVALAGVGSWLADRAHAPARTINARERRARWLDSH